MLPLGLVIPALLVFILALLVVVRELGRAAQNVRTAGTGPLLTVAGEGMLVMGSIMVFAQGWVAGLVLDPIGGFVVFVGGALLFFVGETVESLRPAKH